MKASLNKNRNFKIIVWTGLTLVILVAGLFFFLTKDFIYRNFLTDNLDTEFSLLVSKAIERESSLDMTKFDFVKWDELFFIFPYQNTKQLTFKYEGPPISSADDNEMYLVLLNNNQYVTKISGIRQQIDFSTCGNQDCLSPEKWLDGKAKDEECRCRGKIKKSEAIFDIDFSYKLFRSVKLKKTE